MVLKSDFSFFSTLWLLDCRFLFSNHLFLLAESRFELLESCTDDEDDREGREDEDDKE